jgi:hypothetical protein
MKNLKDILQTSQDIFMMMLEAGVPYLHNASLKWPHCHHDYASLSRKMIAKTFGEFQPCNIVMSGESSMKGKDPYN